MFSSIEGRTMASPFTLHEICDPDARAFSLCPGSGSSAKPAKRHLLRKQHSSFPPLITRRNSFLLGNQKKDLPESRTALWLCTTRVGFLSWHYSSELAHLCAEFGITREMLIRY